MSATIDANDLKFVIFGAGHDYTLADSGRGDLQVFSHPFVPLNSLHYAGQWFFTVTDDQGNIIDAVKDDIAHCTFTPALNTAFDTEGEVEVSVNYHREYIYDEETLVVDKTVSQKVTVVNHGSVSSSTTYFDLYSDGYGFFRPRYTGYVENGTIKYRSTGNPTKVSSIPWRAVYLGDYPNYGFISTYYIQDISELEYADVSNVKEIYGLVQYAQQAPNNIDLSPLSKWDLSNLEICRSLFENSSKIVDLSPLIGWKFPKVTRFDNGFSNTKITSLHGLENLGLENVVYMNHCFDGARQLTNLNAAVNWKLNKLIEAEFMFANCESLTDVSGVVHWGMTAIEKMQSFFYLCPITSVASLHGWNIKPTDIRSMFEGCRMKTLVGLEGFDFSRYTQTMYKVFAGNHKLNNLNGIGGWNISGISNLNNMFYDCPWINDISAIKDWTFHASTVLTNMFAKCADLLTLDGIIWNLGNATMTSMFANLGLFQSSKIGKKVWADAYYYWDEDDTRYTYSQVADVDNPLVQLYGDASEASNWTVTGTGKSAFNSNWTNIPSWN